MAGGNLPAFPWQLGAQEIKLDPPRAFHLPHWGKLTDAQRLAFLRKCAEQAGRDPRIRERVIVILREGGCDQRQYEKQAACLLKWVQTNIDYVNEPGEILQDPLYTLDRRIGDCDDLALLLASFYEAIALSWKFVLSGRDRQGAALLWVEGTPMPSGVKWGHIFNRVGWPALRPTTWAYAEPTVKGAALGWDVVSAGGKLPGAMPTTLPEMAYGAFALVRNTVAGPAVPAGAGAAAMTSMFRFDLQAILAAMVVGVVTTVTATLILDEIRARFGRPLSVGVPAAAAVRHNGRWRASRHQRRRR